MKYVLLFFISSLMDAFYIGGAAWLILEREWSVWTMGLAILLGIMSYPYKFLDAMKEGDD